MHLLSRANSDVLAQLAWSKVLIAFDFDGTLAPIVTDRDDAKMHPRTVELFERVCSLYPCAVISGRSQRDVSRRLEGAAVKYVVGNHGLESWGALPEFDEEIALARSLLEVVFATWSEVDVEDKRYSLALHYRRARNKQLARSAIHEAVAALPMPMRIVPGKLVVNLIPARAPNKGDALLELRSTEQADTALYVGDDITDEDVFKLDQPGRLMSVRVGESQSSVATYFLRSQREIDRLLTKLIAHREKGFIA